MSEHRPSGTYPYDEISDERGEFYQRIVDADQFAEPWETGNGHNDNEISLQIVEDDLIVLAGRELAVQDHKLFALNALLVTRRPMTSEEFRKLGFDPRARASQLAHALNGLNAMMKRAIGFELIDKLARPRNNSFVLSPNVVVSDNRGLPRPPAKPLYEARGGQPSSPNRSKEINAERDSAANAILEEFVDHPEVVQRIDKCKIEPMKKRPEASEIDQFMDFARQFALLKADEEVALASTLEIGFAKYSSIGNLSNLSPEDKQIMIDFAVAHRLMLYSNLRFVVFLAMKRAHNPLPLMDRVSEGAGGLNQAINRFDLTLGYKFSTYARWWIRHSIERAAANKGRIIRLPVNLHENWVTIRRDTQEFIMLHHRAPTEAEIVKRTGIPLSKVRTCLTYGDPIISLDTPLTPDSNATLADLQADPNNDHDRLVEQIAAQTQVDRLFAHPSLSDHEKLVLGLHNGTYDSIPDYLFITGEDGEYIDYRKYIANIATHDGMSFADIGKLLKLSDSRVRKFYTLASQKARKILLED